jgi:hypothetical protein
MQREHNTQDDTKDSAGHAPLARPRHGHNQFRQCNRKQRDRNRVNHEEPPCASILEEGRETAVTNTIALLDGFKREYFARADPTHNEVAPPADEETNRQHNAYGEEPNQSVGHN